MEFACKFIRIERDPMWLVRQGRALNHARVKRGLPYQRKFPVICQKFQICLTQALGALFGLRWQVRDHRARIAKNGLAPGVTVLDIEDGIVTRLLNDFGKIEIKHGVVLAV